MSRQSVLVHPGLAGFAAAVARERQERGWKLSELAEKAGLSTTHAWNAEHGREVSLSVALRIADAFGVEPGSLLPSVPVPCTKCYGTPPSGYTCNLCGVASG